MTLPWWTAVPSARTALACGEGQHQLVWENGALTVPDHADPEGERALAALGGEAFECIELLDGWGRNAENLDVLLLGSRGSSDLIPVPDEQQGGPMRPPRNVRAGGPPGVSSGSASSSVYFYSSGGRSARPGMPENPDEDLARLLPLGGGLDRRLQATVAAHWRERLDNADAELEKLRPRLQAAVYGRVLATLSSWLARTDLAIDLELIADGSAPSLGRTGEDRIAVALPFGWLVEVWARGLELIWGRFCLDASTSDGLQWTLTTVGPDLGEPAVITVILPG
jgi:hypothetical protein